MSTQNQNPKTGVSITGVLKGYFETQNGQYTNRFLAIVKGDYINEYGEQQENIQKIDISPAMAQYVNQISPTLQGQPVRVWVGQQPRYGVKNNKPWGFISTYMLRDTTIENLNEAKPELKKAS